MNLWPATRLGGVVKRYGPITAVTGLGVAFLAMTRNWSR